MTLVSTGEIFGGAERQILLLLQHLRARGIGCELVVFHDSELAARARQAGISTAVVGSGGRFGMRAIRELVHIFRRAAPHLVHVHGYKAAVHVAMARLFVAFRTVKTEHGSVEIRDGKLIERLKARAYRSMENLAVRLLRAHIVYVTRDLASTCAHEHVGLESSVIYNGIDPDQVVGLARPVELDQTRFNVVIAGRLEAVKGVEFALRALGQGDVPQQATLWVIGDGPLREQLEQQAQHLGISSRVRFLGFRTDAAAFIRHADLVLMPSLHEGLPYTLLEAAAAGTAIAASRVGGMAEVLVHGESALLFPVGSVQDIAATIAHLQADPALRSRIASGAQAWVAQGFSARAMTDRYISLFAAVGSAT